MKRNAVLKKLSKGSVIYRFLSTNDWLDDYEFILSSYDGTASLDVISKASAVAAIRASQFLAIDACISVSVFKSKLNFRFVFDIHD